MSLYRVIVSVARKTKVPIATSDQKALGNYEETKDVVKWLKPLPQL
jgi:hypothetical protein